MRYDTFVTQAHSIVSIFAVGLLLGSASYQWSVHLESETEESIAMTTPEQLR